MSALAVTYIHLKFDLSGDEREEAAEYLRYISRRFASLVYRQDVDVRVEVYPGSIKSWIVVGGSIYLAIGQYGSFRSGVDQIIDDAKAIKEYLVTTLVKDGVPEDKVGEVKRRHCLPDKIRYLFLRVDRFEERLHEMDRNDAERELNLIVKAAGRVVDELDHEVDVDQFLQCLDEKFKPSPERIALRYRQPLIKEEDYSVGYAQPIQTNSLSLNQYRREVALSANNTLQGTFDPPPALLPQSMRRLKRP